MGRRRRRTQSRDCIITGCGGWGEAAKPPLICATVLDIFLTRCVPLLRSSFFPYPLHPLLKFWHCFRSLSFLGTRLPPPILRQRALHSVRHRSRQCRAAPVRQRCGVQWRPSLFRRPSWIPPLPRQWVEGRGELARIMRRWGKGRKSRSHRRRPNPLGKGRRG